MGDNSSLEDRIERLSAEVQRLREQVDHLSRQQSSPVPNPAVSLKASEAVGEAEPADAFFSWVGRSALLQRVSAVCFLMVIALILRTLTDSGWLDIRIGSPTGMFYATALMLLGLLQYRSGRPLAPVFAICGALLMFLVVSETHARFSFLPTALAYILVIGTGALMAVISYVSRAALPIFVGTLGLCIAGVALDYPNPSYPALVILLISANALGFVASRLQRCSWLRWTLFLVTAVLIQVWGYKIGLTLGGKAQPSGDLAQRWFFPSMLLFAMGYLLSALYGILRPASEKIARFDFALPAVAGVWSFSVTVYVAQIWLGNLVGVTLLGASAAIAYFSLALWLGQRPGAERRAATSFFLGGSVLAGLVLGLGAGAPLLALGVLAGTAFWGAHLSAQWRLGALRLVSYLVQFYVCFALGSWLLADLHRTQYLPAMALAGALAVAVFWHYRWCLRNPPPAESRFFSKLDEGNRLCIFLLLASLGHAYYFARGVYALVVPDFSSTGLFGFMGMQSVLISVGAVFVMIWSLVRRDREMRNLAVLITLVGAGKVFLFDLLGLSGQGIEGFPLVVSIFSFGAAIAVQSLVLGRWLRIGAACTPTQKEQSGQGSESSAARR
ncbi:Predicted membrane protein [Geoalkalibacter ferrihydriticus]|uniref:DUF2339 domain-containing protein n=2 Tax=Geoalkalibacter ferrihydriticus TaxID=392333 RepID=A0A0C2HS51_9BACT|nr:DUF2339 domain-containing protein [Geoalkalibacter ferrihydriticus]KIH77630.1 hypothetical protein GFER_02845 [Geoalkalibacter ferrihydriticus DSM 17813]SDL70966.1 Predicted membrane protein [Geoalkalibacter ferrihydriticus]